MSESIYTRKPRLNRRVVVTGISTVNPLGLNAKESWSNALEGKSGIAAITAFDTTDYTTKFGGEVKNFNVDDFVIKKNQKKMDRFIHFSQACADMALKDAGLEGNLGARAGTFMGVGLGGLPIIEKQRDIVVGRGPSRISPFFIPSVISNLSSGHISIDTGAKGPNFAVTSACASGSHAIGEAAEYIRRGVCDIMIAGGSESVMCPLALGGFSAMKALSKRNDSPSEASRPWDKDRDGFVLAEGAAVLILEDYESAAKRGAKIYAELSGYGVSSDAHHITTPSADGAGAAMAMSMALRDAELNHNDIDYINAHGTSTPAGDEVESNAVKLVFKDHAKQLCVSSTKSMTGHTLGAAGAIESVFAIQSLQNNKVLPTINLENPSEACDLDYVPFSARDKELKHVLNNSFGFGGTNASLIFSKI